MGANSWRTQEEKMNICVIYYVFERMKTLNFFFRFHFFFFFFFVLLVSLFCLHFCLVSQFKIIRCFVKSWIATYEIKLKKEENLKCFSGTIAIAWEPKPVYQSPKQPGYISVITPLQYIITYSWMGSSNSVK